MPKARKVVLASVRFDPSQFAEPEWQAVESAMGKKFAPDERTEIRRALAIFRLRQAQQEHQPTIMAVEALRLELLNHVLGLLELADRFRPNGAMASAEEGDEALFLALAFSIKDTSFSLTECLSALRPICTKMVQVLELDELAYNISSRMPATVGLAYFIGEALKGATGRPARASPGYQTSNPTAVEYHRWGLHLSAQVGDLSKFMSVLTGTSVSQNQIQGAWAEAKRLGLLPSQ